MKKRILSIVCILTLCVSMCVGTVATANAADASESTVSANYFTATSIKLNKTSLTLGVNERYQLKATLTPSTAANKVTYSSTKVDVATVDKNGLVKAVGVGSSTIIAKTSNGKRATCKVTVKQPYTQVAFNKGSMTLGIGETNTLTLYSQYGDQGGSVTFSSSDSSIASVVKKSNKTVDIRAKKMGSCTITAKTYNNRKATCKITVKLDPSAIWFYDYADVSQGMHTLNLGKGESYRLSVIQDPYPTAGGSVTYSSSNTKVATVDRNTGYLKAVGTGSCTITAKSYRSILQPATLKVTVKSAPTKVTLSKSSISLKAGKTYKLTVSTPGGFCHPADLKCTSTNSKIASAKCVTVKNDTDKLDYVKITANKKGTATITVTTYNGKKATCKVTVK